jgi:hypothetical protein
MMAPQRRALRFSITLPISQAGDLGVGWDGGQCVPMQIFLILYELTKIYFYCNVLQNYTTVPVGNSGRGMNLNGDKFYMKIVSFVEIYNFVV